MTVISVIVGRTREGRFSEKPARSILQHLKKRDGVDARLLDLRDFPMPFFDQPATPATPGRPPYKNEVVQRWTAAIAQSDGFVFVTPEYNYGPLRGAQKRHRLGLSGVESQGGFVSYGSAMGARSVQQLRQTVIELQLAPIPSSVFHPCRHPVGSLQGRRCRRRAGAAGRACRGDDRRSAVVDAALKTARASAAGTARRR
jgi:NAD(P)H-dependent FMN reductase